MTAMMAMTTVRGLTQAMRTFAPLGAALCVSTVTEAHHSRALYDTTKEVVIEGTVAELEWRNPHVSLTVETKSADGTAVRRDIEVMSVSEARALGLRVIPWTVNTPSDIAKVLDLGVDGIISNRPDRVREEMKRRRMPLPGTVE